MPEKTGAIELLVEHDCGGIEDKLIPAVHRHGHDAHNMDPTRKQVLALARPI